MNEKPPFLTKAEIEKRIKTGGLQEVEKGDLWDAMYPTAEEIPLILKLVKSKNAQPFIYPMISTAACTGTRRSELMRAKLTDVNMDDRVITIHEKKWVRGKNSTRRVPIVYSLYQVLDDWLKAHPGGPFLFCLGSSVTRSKKRSTTTTHGVTNGPSTASSRTVSLKIRPTQPFAPLTKDEAHNHLKAVFKYSEWSHIRGWHFFRHGFIGACASAAVDQRYIEEWVGHQTDEQRKRYRHPAPSSQQVAIAREFQ